MAINKTWSILGLKRKTSDGGVIQAEWQFMAKADSGEFAVSMGKSSFTPDSSEPGFIPFDSLTEADVVAWVKDDLGADAVSEMEADRVSKVEAQIEKNSSVESGLPWAIPLGEVDETQINP